MGFNQHCIKQAISPYLIEQGAPAVVGVFHQQLPLPPLAPVVPYHSVRVHTRMVEVGGGPTIVFRPCAQMPLFLQRVVVNVIELLQEHFLGV